MVFKYLLPISQDSAWLVVAGCLPAGGLLLVIPPKWTVNSKVSRLLESGEGSHQKFLRKSVIKLLVEVEAPSSGCEGKWVCFEVMESLLVS